MLVFQRPWLSLNEAISVRELFMLDPNVVFLNHGSFGACPASVFAAYQEWQRQLESQPVAFLGRRANALMDEARSRLAVYLNTAPENIVFVVNATAGVNMVARSMPLQPGDEVLSTDQEYGAVDKTWQFVCRKTGARLARHTVPLPVSDHQTFVEALFQEVTPRTRIISISHITSPTALILPVAEICHRARALGILTLIDGAHAPGQIPLDLSSIDADFYVGNCHKWMCAPKGVGFLYARPEHQDLIEPLIISHGWDETSSFVARNQWQGTRDLAPFLSVPAAIDFMERHNWPAVQARCHGMACQLQQKLAALTGLQPLANDGDMWLGQMVAAPLPPCNPDDVRAALYQRYCIEVPLIVRLQSVLIRVSFQAYNTEADAQALFYALSELFDL